MKETGKMLSCIRASSMRRGYSSSLKRHLTNVLVLVDLNRSQVNLMTRHFPLKTPASSSLATSGSKRDLGGQVRAFSTKNLPRDSAAMDPNHHTAGRWLHRDKLHREARNINFDFEALCENAIKLCPGESKVTHCQKIEGGFNRSFILTLDHGSKLVARLPTTVAGPPRLTTHSEVATMEYREFKPSSTAHPLWVCADLAHLQVRSHTSIPIPKVLEWNDDPPNHIGAEYIIMEYVTGVSLSEKWDTMDTLQQLECTKALTLMLKQMADIEFPAYGSVYFGDALVGGNLNIPFTNDYCIGPYCAPTYWKRGIGDVACYGGDIPDCGPWKDLPEFCDGLIMTGLSRLPNQDVERRAAYQGSVQEHTRLLQASRAVMSQLIQHTPLQEAADPILWHPDFHKRNIFVSEEDPTVITGVIDWTSTGVQPAFMNATETPHFASLPEDLPFLQRLGEREELGEYEPKAASICAQTFDVIVKGYIPRLQAGRDLDPALSRIFHYSLTSWTSSATAIREELIDLSQRWKNLGLAGSSHYTVSEEEIASHKKMYTDLHDAMKLKAGLMRVLGANPDGYVSNDGWERAKGALPLLREEWMKSAVESGTSEQDAKAMFPFDGS